MASRLAELPFSRKYLIVATIFVVALAASFWLFATLLAEQLSRSYLEDVLLSGRAHAEEIARTAEGGQSIYQVVEQRRESLERLSDALARQRVVESVQVYDKLGKLVYQTVTNIDGLSGGFAEQGTDLLLPTSKEDVVETKHEYQIRTPLSDIGTVVVRIPKEALGTRIEDLRRRLLLRAGVAGGVTIAVLMGAVAFIWHLVQRNAELEERRRLNDELAALGTLAANLAHEIRNPLNALSINLELLEEELAGGSQPPEATRLARREVARLARLVNDFLVYARPTPPRLEEVELGPLVEEVAELMRGECERAGIELRVQPCEAAVKADRGQLFQVLVNLAQNACQAVAASPRKVVTLAASADDTSAVLEVLDTGPGISRGDMPRVREAFFSRRKGGTGLGLAIADRVVASHGGTLALLNQPEGGLRARIVLPRAAAKNV
ncbi:MAG TPA: ATP-binding protein [Thermoanaerobaculaceae bacterium]|nr:ATP-binding protein [Thermoanaerobaculaceae bacterium]HRS16677.1 ATP-binding protein [Thermoanaerobaculaceae bacterium]